MLQRPKLLIVGGPDVDTRLELMHCLKAEFDVSALGSRSELYDRFAAAGFSYSHYTLSPQANPVLDLWGVCQLVSIFQRSNPQIVHTFATKPGVWGRLAARLAGVPIIIGTLPGLGSLYASDNFTTQLLRLVYQPLQKLACHFSDLTIFQNQDDACQFIAARVVPAQKVRVIAGSGVSTNLFDSTRVSDSERIRLKEELGFQPGEIVVTMISRVIRSKGVLEYMAAAQNIGSCHPRIRFLLVGPNDDRSVDRLNSTELIQLKQTVIWPGPRRDIPTILAVSDIFVLPSAYREGIPRVLLEAASMGLPIVTTNSPGCNEVVENGVNGFLVQVCDLEALSQAILYLIEQPELRRRFGHASRQRAVERFDLSLIAEQTRSIYWQLLALKRLSPTSEVLTAS